VLRNDSPIRSANLLFLQQIAGSHETKLMSELLEPASQKADAQMKKRGRSKASLSGLRAAAAAEDKRWVMVRAVVCA
jgi:hypothetical protein